MGATISVGGKSIAVAYTKHDIYSAIMDGRAGRGFELIVDGQEADIIREAMRRYCEEPSKAAGAPQLKPRPIAEAPIGVDILAQYGDGSFSVIELSQPPQTSAVGFYEIADLLRAAEILAAITPEGYELTGEHRTAERGEYWLFYNGALFEAVSGPGTDFCSFILRKLPPPVRYEFVAEEKPRIPKKGDWVMTCDEQWVEITADLANTMKICARRVEGKP